MLHSCFHMFVLHWQIDEDPNGVIPNRRRQFGEQLNELLQYGGEPMEFEDDDGHLGGEEARFDKIYMPKPVY